jgi:hypothetical protein
MARLHTYLAVAHCLVTSASKQIKKDNIGSAPSIYRPMARSSKLAVPILNEPLKATLLDTFNLLMLSRFCSLVAPRPPRQGKKKPVLIYDY